MPEYDRAILLQTAKSALENAIKALEMLGEDDDEARVRLETYLLPILRNMVSDYHMPFSYVPESIPAMQHYFAERD